jgi:HEAT repeat protein
VLPLTSILFVGALSSASLCAALTLYVLGVQRRRDAARAALAAVLGALKADSGRRLSTVERADRVRPLLAGWSRELLMRAAADQTTPDDVFGPLAVHLTERWGIEALLENAAAHQSPRDKWRRVTALRILARLHHPQRMELLARAVEEEDEEVADAAFGILGNSSDPRAMDILFGALARQRHPASRIAAHIEHSRQPIADRLVRGLDHPDPVVRLWSAALLARCPDAHAEDDLVRLTHDADPRVRKAAIQTLGTLGAETAADCAIRLLDDPLPYVRAHAARALGELGRTDLAPAVSVLLGDADWWARLAAREALEMMGPDVWPVMVRCLDHEDRFVRNGAAEVVQNLGVLDCLVIMEAATDSPAESKIAMLRRIAQAGGVRFTDSLVERAGPIIGARIRLLLANIGLEHVGAFPS